MSDGEDYVYIAVKPCGHAGGMCVDEPEYKEDCARNVADWIRQGYAVNRVSRAEGIAKLGTCEHGTMRQQSAAQT